MRRRYISCRGSNAEPPQCPRHRLPLTQEAAFSFGRGRLNQARIAVHHRRLRPDLELGVEFESAARHDELALGEA